MTQVDFRLVQTAVMGGRDSDQPVILPEEPHNLDEFRRQFGKDDFWCGRLLGGCGERLMTKRYETKVCHFSHFPDRDGSRAACHRTAKGVDSADHLFIKTQVTQWLAGQGHATQAELRSLGHGPGDAVDFVLRATNQRLRFELRSNDYRSWRGTADSLAAKEGHVEWVFGLESAITRDVTARYGYALRVRCETDGNSRRVLIGTVTENRPVAWTALEQCRMTGDGLITPELDELRGRGLIRAGAMRHEALAGSLPLRGAEIVFAVDAKARPDTGTPLSEGGRYLISGFIKPTGHRILKAQLSLPQDTPLPTESYVYRLAGAVRLLVTEADRSDGSTRWAVRADSLVQLNGLDAERTGLWRPPVALDEPLHPPAPSTPSAPMATTVTAQTGGSPTATALRRALERVAREGATTTWKELAHRIGLDFAHLPDPKRRDLLVEVDKPRDGNRPLLCVLVRAPSGRPLPYLSTVLRLLQVPAPASESALNRWSDDQIRAVHTAYGHRAAPASASTAVTEAPRPTEAQDAQQQLIFLTAQLVAGRATLPRATGRRAARLAATVKAGEQHQQLYETVRHRRHELRAWQREAARLLGDLDRLIGHTVPTPARATGTTAVPTAAASPASSRRSRSTFQAQTAADIARLTKLFKQARDADDLAEAIQVRKEAARIPTAQLAGEPRQNLLLLRTDLQTWINSREAAAAHVALRTLLTDLSTADPAPTPLALRSALAHSKILKRRCPGPLPQDIHTALTRLEAQVNDESSAASDDGTSPSAAQPSPSGSRPSDAAAFAEARQEFTWLVAEIRAAQEADDLAAVDAARRLAGPVYGRRLSPEDRDTYTPLMREVKAWCQERDPNTDPVLRGIRKALDELGRTGDTLTTEQLATILEEIDSLRRRLEQRLPVIEEVQVKRWKRQLKTRVSAARQRTAPRAANPAKPASAPEAHASPHPDRLPIETIDKLAAIARDVLKDAARSGGSLLTWGDLRLRMAGGLPHLHPDDQGELLVAVDRETPADEPLLSTLVASTDTSLHWLYRHVRFSLGRERIPEPDLPAHWATEVLRLRQTWRHR
ncbi:hypothetical protein [Streptomyces justiciae]|uniref:hypothetical protein n=1 Tax=Streptomyces justiciae TaxID=2780140 RepID=UPI0018824D66|nr:hypothetical protein [Streptomyces justiciae]MBE8477459.1 hypothetical protein [Streptomyces justiciae]